MNKSNIKHGIAGVLILTLIFLYEYYKSDKLLSNHNYTIGQVYDFTRASRGGRGILYEFEINGKIYKGITPNEFNREKMLSLKKKHFFVIFSPDNPKNNGILLEKSINKDLYDIPPQGWTKKPLGCPDIK